MTVNQLNWAKDNFENIETAWAGDLWDRERLGIQLTNYVDRLQCGAVLALDARWGEGKTWFVRHWAKHLTDKEHNVIYLDAFANDYLDDPFLVIASEIAAKLDQTAENKPLVHKFKKAAAVMQQGLLTLAPTLIASMISCALTGGIIPLIKIDSEKISDKLDEAIDKVTNNIGEKVTEAIQNKIDSYEEEKGSLIAFKETLAQLASNLDKPLVFIIDELDRCRPDFAIRLIERIKHFFDIPKIVFVLVMDKAQFSKAVCHNYGYDETFGEEYLDKFFDSQINLPQIYEEDRFVMVSKTLQNLGIDVSNDVFEGVDNLITLLGRYHGYTSRQLKKIINNFSLYALDTHIRNIILIMYLFNKERMNQATSSVDAYKVIFDFLKSVIDADEYYHSKYNEYRKNIAQSGFKKTDYQLIAHLLENDLKIQGFMELAEILSYPQHYSFDDLKLLPHGNEQSKQFSYSWSKYVNSGL